MQPRNASQQRNRDAGAWQLRSIVPVVALMVALLCRASTAFFSGIAGHEPERACELEGAPAVHLARRPFSQEVLLISIHHGSKKMKSWSPRYNPVE